MVPEWTRGESKYTVEDIGALVYVRVCVCTKQNEVEQYSAPSQPSRKVEDRRMGSEG
jgi:hypothetical protein